MLNVTVFLQDAPAVLTFAIDSVEKKILLSTMKGACSEEQVRMRADGYGLSKSGLVTYPTPTPFACGVCVLLSALFHGH